MPEYNATASTLVTRSESVPELGSLYGATTGTRGTVVSTYFMRGLNASNNFVYWHVEEEPDLQATYAPEPIPDLSTITIAGEWIG